MPRRQTMPLEEYEALMAELEELRAFKAAATAPPSQDDPPNPEDPAPEAPPAEDPPADPVETTTTVQDSISEVPPDVTPDS